MSEAATRDKKMEPYTEKWERLAGSIARTYLPGMYPCNKCGGPVVRGYICETCGCSNPSHEQDEE